MSVEQVAYWKWSCDRCGYTDTSQREGFPPDERWETVRTVRVVQGEARRLCPGCACDLGRFLANRPTEMMHLGDAYRHPVADEGATDA